MGKIKVRTLGTETEEQEKKDQKKKSVERKLAKVPGKGGERVVEVGPSEEELKKLEEKAVEKPQEEVKKEKKAKFAKPKHTRSKRYQDLKQTVDKTPVSINQALSLLEKLQRKTFDETVELHLNTKDPKVSTSTTLPHGTGKNLKVEVASDEVVSQIENGKIDFDILLAAPSMMPKLAKVAKVLGPKGLMPNPKNGTITDNPQETAKKYQGGLTFIRTEGKAPLIHIAIGKISFGQKKLEENIDAILSAVKKENIDKAILKSTMSPAIKIQI